MSFIHKIQYLKQFFTYQDKTKYKVIESPDKFDIT